MLHWLVVIRNAMIFDVTSDVSLLPTFHRCDGRDCLTVLTVLILCQERLERFDLSDSLTFCIFGGWPRADPLTN